jgi:hypothetical protein
MSTLSCREPPEGLALPDASGFCEWPSPAAAAAKPVDLLHFGVAGHRH